ncbi:hypothetical protein GW17_00027467 [Ensete ventricosum]|nr:hypothetical protein GW17_00027467 [Ensete ventricosum]
MSLFLSDEEFRLLSDDAAAVAERADGVIRDVRCQLDTVRAEADAAAISAEQNCALLEQRYETLSSDLARVRSENAQLSASLEQRLSEIADAQAEKHQLHLKAIAKDGEMERLSLEAAELNKSKRHLLELLEQKDAEIREKNATIQSYLDKIINLTDSAVDKEGRLQNQEAELARCHATCVRFNQVKITYCTVRPCTARYVPVRQLTGMRTVATGLYCQKATADGRLKEKSTVGGRLRRNQEGKKKKKRKRRRRRSEREKVSRAVLACVPSPPAGRPRAIFLPARGEKIEQEKELLEKHNAWLNEELNAKVNSLVGEHKTHMEIVADMSAKLADVSDASDMKGKLEQYEAELENARKANELSIIPMSRFHADANLEELSVAETTSCRTYENNQILVPKFPIGISGTALAASLIRDGWSLAKMYEKYQEAADAVRHEKWGRKNAEAVLERVLILTIAP